MPPRRRILQGSAAVLAMPLMARGEDSGVLKVVPQADLAWTTSYQTRDHGFLVFDTLFGVASRFQASPQMAEGAVSEADGRLWRITLRDGLRFHDGSNVLARDAAASVRRWGARDGFGQALLAARDEVAAADDRTLVFRLKRPFPLLPDALRKSLAQPVPDHAAATGGDRSVHPGDGDGRQRPYRYWVNISCQPPTGQP